MITSLDGRETTERSVVALGMFDGVHRGHQVLLRKARREATFAGAPMVCCTFAEHPSRLLCPEKCPPLLTTLDERIRLIEKLRADVLCADPFTDKLRDMPAADFIGRLVQRWHPAVVVVGYNYTFGRNAEGTAALMDQVGYALSFATIVVPEVRMDGEIVSSTHIRELLGAGKAIDAARLLGRPYAQTAAWEADRLLRMRADGKQALPRGRYRVLLESGGRTLPDVLEVIGDGTARTTLTGAASASAEATIHYLSEIDR